MGIRDKRFYRAVNRIIQEELQKGNLPSSKEFTWRLNEYLRSYDLSRPSYRFKQVREGNIASSFDYNNQVDRIHEDLSTLYENTIDIHNLLSKNFSKFEVDKSKLEYEINMLENQLKEDILLYRGNGYLNSVIETFDDMTKVQAEETSAHVDIKKHEVSIPQVKNTSRKITPDASVSFNVLPEIEEDVASVPVSGVPSDALSNTINRTWQQLFYSESKQSIGGYYTVNFREKQSLNRIEVMLHTIKPTTIRVEFSPDNINWFALPYNEGNKVVASEAYFDFPTLEARSLRILMIKSEPDDQSVGTSFTEASKGGGYKYLIGLKHLGFYEMNYPTSATFVSSPLKVKSTPGVNFSINKVSLFTEEVVPGASDIKYSIALPEEGRELDWRPISPVTRENPQHEQIVDFRTITKASPKKLQIDPSISIAEYELENLYANGIQFYSVGEVETNKIIDSSERLFVGRDTWGVRRFAKEQADHNTYVPSIEDWKSPESYEYEYVKMMAGKSGLLLNGRRHDEAWNYMFTTGVFSEKLQEIDSAIPASTEPIAIYVNGKEVYRGMPSASSRVTYKFNYGWNEVIVLLYVRNTGAALGSTLDVNFDVKKYGANVYSQVKPLEKVTLHDLRYNVKSNDRSKYAIHTVNDKSYIILNHAVSGLEYDFYYDYVDGDTKDTIILKAEFTKNEVYTSISPKLKGYKLRFS